jgi:hypothetical protein
MARYDTYTSKDDVIREDLDIGFKGFNNRLRPDQLTTGILFDSQNGRMAQNGEWQTRKGIDNIKAPLSTGETAMSLPFFLINDATGYTSNTLVAASIFKFDASSYSRSSETLTINFNSHTLIDGDIISISGLSVSGGVNPNGTRTVTNASTNSFDIVVTGMTATPTGTLAVDTQRLYIVIPQNLTSTLSLAMSGVVYIDTANIGGISMTTSNHSVRITAIDSSSATFRVNDVTYTSGTPSGTVDLDSATLADANVNEVYGSCIFSDPNADSESYIILAANTKAIAVKVSDPSTTYDLTYPTGETVSSPVEMTQAFNKLIIFRDGDTPFEKDLSTTNINTSPQLDKVDSGTYTQPIPISVTNLDIASGVATATVGSTATLKRGDTFTITATNSSIAVGTVANVDDLGDSSGSSTATKFRFITNVVDQSGKSATIEKPMSEGLGFTHMPAPAYGVYHQRRLAVPYRYSVTAGSSDTYADRKIFDEILLSDILDTDTYDQIFGQFRFNAGRSDFNVGMLSFSDDKLVVFNRNSIHIVVGNGDLANFKVQLLTDEVGLTAKNSVIQVGNQVIFLSDNGVYGLSFVDLYNLRGNEVPLSESIQKTIDTINKAHVDKASAVYFDNKYYLAVPTGTSTVNNTLIIYNFLNKSWESIDNVNNVNLAGTTFSSFEFTNLLVAGKGTDRGVYVTNTDGGIHKLEVFADGIDRVITDIGVTSETETRVQGSASTRMFTLKSIDRKKWNNFELHLQSGLDNSSDVSISATTENLDSEPALDLKKASDYLGGVIAPDEDVSVRGRIGNKRAYGLQMTLTSLQGRPRFRSLKVAGAETFRSTSSVQ